MRIAHENQRMFFLPLFDDNPTKSRPLVSWLVIVICTLVYLYQSGLNARDGYALVVIYGVIPARLFSEFDILTIITSMFLHGGFMHILFNMIWLSFFSKFVLNLFSEKRFLTIYLLGCLLYTSPSPRDA